MQNDTPEVLITGATGQVGRGVIKFLNGRKRIAIISAVRNPAKAAQQEIPSRVFDFDRPRALKPR